VMVPLREAELVGINCVAYRYRVPLLEPLAGVTVSQEVALLVAVQGKLEVTVTIFVVAADDTVQLDMLSARLGVGVGPPVTVTV